MPAQASRRKKPGRHPLVLEGTVHITRQVHFNAAHRLCNPARSLAWNRRQYGLCANPNWHGHNYVLEVTVKGRPNPETGFVIDLAGLKRILHDAVVGPCDHRNLNTEVAFLHGTIPTTENLVIAFWREIEPHLPPAATLHRVRLYETPRNFADYYGPDAS
jgi:6-pyruvoyltetrahydropterin/6-carboxytetrahydropterin synthase